LSKVVVPTLLGAVRNGGNNTGGGTLNTISGSTNFTSLNLREVKQMDSHSTTREGGNKDTKRETKPARRRDGVKSRRSWQLLESIDASPPKKGYGETAMNKKLETIVEILIPKSRHKGPRIGS